MSAEGRDWREQALSLQEQLAAATGAQCGITQAGELVVVPADH